MATFVTKPEESNVTQEQSGKGVVRFGIVGYGYWGPKVIRNLDLLEETKVVAICDKSAVSRRKAEKAYAGVLVTDDPNELMTSPDIDAIAVITPVWTHYE